MNEDKGFMVLAGDVFDVPIRKDIIRRVVWWQLAKRQQGTHSTKTISEISGTGRKPWKQKGTGRARHGSLRGPQFRGGATMHGPKPQSHAIKLNKKVRRLGLKIALSALAGEGKLIVLDDLEVPTHKTKNIANYVKHMESTKKVLLVDGGPINEKLKLSTQNLHSVNLLPSIGLIVYSILLHDALVMSRDAVNRIVERMNAPVNRQRRFLGGYIFLNVEEELEGFGFSGKAAVIGFLMLLVSNSMTGKGSSEGNRVPTLHLYSVSAAFIVNNI